MVQGARPRVLIVEDEPLVLMDLEAQLIDLGCDVAGKAYDQQTGLACARQLDVDLALLDVNLGGADSSKIADALAIRGIPFMFVSGYSEQGIPDQYRGCVRLTKPYTPHSLGIALRRVLAAGKQPS